MFLTKALEILHVTFAFRKGSKDYDDDDERDDTVEDNGTIETSEWLYIKNPPYVWTSNGPELKYAVLILSTSHVKNINSGPDDTEFEPDAVFTKTHSESGWTISACIRSGSEEWIKDFTATHAQYGTIDGDFATKITATSKEGFDHFYRHHPPTKFNYRDI
jgi:hypothetical protein